MRDDELLPQGQVLEDELAVAAAEEREETDQVEEDGDHQARIVARPQPADQPLARRAVSFAKTSSDSVEDSQCS
jgi:hypothetical protein